MREHIIKVWCDRCESLGQPRTEAQHTYTVGIVQGENRPELRVIELCDECDAAEVSTMVKLLGTFSISFDPKASTEPQKYVPANKETCQVCGNDYSKTSLVTHIWKIHRPGETKPEHPKKCPDCGLVNPDGMGQHRSQSHGWTPLTDAYRGLV